MAYSSRNWTATETSDLVGSKHELTVSGEVEVHRSNQVPKLTEAQPQGISPTTLILTLKVESHGDVGEEVLDWKTVTFTKTISARQYHDVTITGDTNEQTVKVHRILS